MFPKPYRFEAIIQVKCSKSNYYIHTLKFCNFGDDHFLGKKKFFLTYKKSWKMNLNPNPWAACSVYFHHLYFSIIMLRILYYSQCCINENMEIIFWPLQIIKYIAKILINLDFGSTLTKLIHVPTAPKRFTQFKFEKYNTDIFKFL